jgi:hypothetical protein
MTDHTRRRFLRASGLATVASLSGCTIGGYRIEASTATGGEGDRTGRRTSTPTTETGDGGGTNATNIPVTNQTGNIPDPVTIPVHVRDFTVVAEEIVGPDMNLFGEIVWEVDSIGFDRESHSNADDFVLWQKEAVKAEYRRLAWTKEEDLETTPDDLEVILRIPPSGNLNAYGVYVFARLFAISEREGGGNEPRFLGAEWKKTPVSEVPAKKETITLEGENRKVDLTYAVERF